MKEEENNLIFKPQLNTNSVNLSKLGGDSFLDRVSYFKTKQENKIKELKSKKG